jgi:hypothetical protein
MNWYRRYHGTCADPKFRLIARNTGIPTPFAIAAWDAVLETASANEDDRGGINGLDAEMLAMTIDCSEEQATALLAEFVRRGMIMNGRVAKWENRQRRSDNSAERVRRHRSGVGSNGPETGNQGNGECNVTDGSGNVTTLNRNGPYPRAQIFEIREDSDKKDSGLRPDATTTAALGDSTPARGEQGCAPDGAVVVVGRVSPDLIRKISIKAAIHGTRPHEVERRVALMVRQWGDASAVELLLAKALERAHGNPLDYAAGTLIRWRADETARVEAAKVAAVEPPDNSILDGYHLSLQIAAKMRENNAHDITGTCIEVVA